MRFAKISSSSVFLIFCQFLGPSPFHFLPSLCAMTNTLNSLWHFWQPGHLFPILFKNPDHVRADSVFPPFPVSSSFCSPSPFGHFQQKSLVIFHAVSATRQPLKHLSLILWVSEVLRLPTRTFWEHGVDPRISNPPCCNWSLFPHFEKKDWEKNARGGVRPGRLAAARGLCWPAAVPRRLPTAALRGQSGERD